MSGAGEKSAETIVALNRLDEVERVSHALEAYGNRHRIPARDVFDANLALDEVLTNIVSYAYDDEAAREITVRLRTEEGRFTVEVEDDGRPFDPLATVEPDLALPVHARPVGGLGLSLVRRLMPELRYERRGGRNVFTMTRSIGDSGRAGAGASVGVTERNTNGVTVLEAAGRLDAAGAAAFEREVLGRVAAGERSIVVDCSKLVYINSAGLRVLLVAAKRLAAAGGGFALAAAAGQIRSVVDIVGFDTVFPVCDTVEAATTAVLKNRGREP